jgi:16S rRNA (cytidine1402-2'-O)-methyltransferase
LTTTTTHNDVPAAAFAPGLYLVATPIGNLQDITLRAIAVLKAADVILCEDTRVSRKLLQYYDITRPLLVYNDQSEQHGHEQTLDRIRSGQVVALISDAGMPLMSDPGYQLVRTCQDAGLMVTSIPGPSSILSALQISGLPTDAFLFLGFLPNKSGERQKRLRSVAGVAATLIMFERAERVHDLLQDVQVACGDRSVAVVRELTKMFEQVRRGLVTDILVGIKNDPLRGEAVVLVDRMSEGTELGDDVLLELLRTHLAEGTLRAAVDQVVADTGAPRRHVYDLALTLKD